MNKEEIENNSKLTKKEKDRNSHIIDIEILEEQLNKIFGNWENE